MGDDEVPPRPAGAERTGLHHCLKRAKAAKAAVVLTVIVAGTVWPLTGLGLPFVDLPDVGLPSFGVVRDVDPPGWADGVLDVLKPVKNGVVALLVLLAAFGEYERRRSKQPSESSDGDNPDEPSDENSGDPTP